jgi:hypothetical protein
MSTVPTDITSWLWAGQTHASPVAIQLFTAPASAGVGRIILFASVADGQCFRLVSPDRFGEFLQQHGRCQIICADAAELHWTIHEDAVRLGEAALIRAELWRMSAEHRLLDVQLFEQLVQLAVSGDESSARPLAELIPTWCGHAWEAVDLIGDAAFALRDFERFPHELVLRASRVAWSLWNLYHVLFQVAETAANKSVGFTADSPYGPLGLGLSVQARIALEKPQHNLVVDESRAPEAIAELEQEIAELTPSIRKLPRLADCLRWNGEKIVLHSDLPRELDDRRLRRLLLDCSGELLGPDGAPFPYLLNERGTTSLLPDDWGVLGNCESNLRGWCRLNTLTQLLHFIRKYQGRAIDIESTVVPRLRPQLPAIVLTALIERGLLRRPEGGSQLTLDFVGLDNCALAAWCEHHFESSVLARAYRSGEDPVDRLADRLTMTHRTAHQQKAAAQLLLTAIAYKLGPESFRKMVLLELGHDLDLSTALHWEKTAFELFPELHKYQDDVVDRVACNLKVDRTKVEQELATRADFASIGAQVLGRQRRGAAFHKLIDLIQDFRLRAQASSAGGYAALYTAVFGRSFRLPTGRVRAHCIFAPGNAEWLDLADDALKAAIYSVAAAGIEIMAVANRKVLVGFGDQRDPQSIITLAADAVSRVLAIPVKIVAN